MRALPWWPRSSPPAPPETIVDGAAGRADIADAITSV